MSPKGEHFQGESWAEGTESLTGSSVLHSVPGGAGRDYPLMVGEKSQRSMGHGSQGSGHYDKVELTSAGRMRKCHLLVQHFTVHSWELFLSPLL